MNRDELKLISEYRDYPCHFERLAWLFETIEKNTPKNEVAKVLDVGCGTGHITIPLGLIPNAVIDGIDMYQPNIDIARANNRFENVRIEFSWLHDWNISEYNFIIFTEVLEHIDAYKEVLKYLGDNMRIDGRLLITIPNGWGPFEWAMTPLYWMRKMGLNDFIWKVKKLLGKKEPYSVNYETPHVNFFTIGRLRDELKTYNLEITQIKNAYLLSPIIETYLPFIPLAFISKMDNAIVQYLPHFIASGWYFVIEKTK